VPFAQVNVKPGISWRYHDIPAVKLSGANVYAEGGVVLGSPQTFAESGEDWWYDIENLYEGGQHVGYMICGFATWQNIGYDEQLFVEDQGCAQTGVVGPDCDRPVIDGHPIGPKFTTVARYDLRGNMVWCRAQTKSIEGAISLDVTSDGGCIYTGWSNATRTISGALIPYNPTIGDDETDINDLVDCEDFKFKMIVGKLNSSGGLEWLNSYGYDLGGAYTDEEIMAAASIGYDVLEIEGSDPVQYRVVGRCQDPSNVDVSGVLYTKGFVVDLDEDGMILNKSLIGTNNSYNDFREIEQSKDNLDEFYITGYWKQGALGSFESDNKAILLKIDEDQDLLPFGTTSWNGTTAFIKSPTISGRNNVGWDVKILENGNVAWAFLDNGKNALAAGTDNYGNAFLYIIDPSDNSFVSANLASVNTYGFSRFQAFDLKLGLIATADGGVALLSSYRVDSTILGEEPYVTYLNNLNAQIAGIECDFNSGPWNTNAYIAKFDESANLLWDKSFDADPNGALDYPGDMKEQECVFRITEADDGGLVFVGNTSHNADDYYLAKVSGDCCVKKYMDDDYDIVGYPYNKNIEVNTTWNSTYPGNNSSVVGTVVVKAVKTLTIDGITMEFADSRKMDFETKIIVEPGGRLKLINGAKLTSLSDCENSMWNGVEIHGEKDVPQTSAYQGTLEMNNATIENAIIGVACVGRENFNVHSWKAGGILKITNSFFTNNLIGVEMRPTQNKDVYGNIIDNVSFIKNTEFLIEGELNDPEIAYASHVFTPGNGQRETKLRAHQEFILLQGIRGVKISGCDFEIDETFGEDVERRWKGYGILSWDSSYDLRPIALYVGDPSADRNTFSNLEIGVYAKAITTTNDVLVDGCIFNNNHYGVAFEGNSNYSSIINNSFNVEEHDHAFVFGSPFQNAAAGIYLQSTAGFTIENNVFDGVAQSVTGQNAGIFVKNSSAIAGSGGEIYRNEFSKLDVSLQSSNNNSLLAVDCNEFTLLSYVNPKWTWHNANGVVMNQGFCDPDDPEAPQANSFIGTYSGTNYQINNQGPAFEYNHYPEAIYTPTNYINVDVEGCTGLPFPENSSACPARNANDDISGLMVIIADLEDDIADVKFQINQGDTSQASAALLNYLQNKKIQEVNYAARYYIDSTNFDYVISLLESNYTIQSSSALLPILMETENTTKFENHLDSIRNYASLDSTSELSNNLYAMADFYELAYAIQTQSGGLDSISAGQIQDLIQLMEDSTDISVNAENYLELLGLNEIDILYLQPLPGETQNMAPSFNEQNDDLIMSNKSNLIDFNMYPNPATDEITISYDFDETATLTIFDLTGRIIYSTLLSSNRNTVLINLNLAATGTYLVHVQLANGNKTVKRLVIQ